MPGFLKLLLSQKLICVCLCVCVPLRLLKTIYVIKISRTALQMTLAVDIIDKHGLSNEVYHKLLPRVSKVMLYLPFISQ